MQEIQRIISSAQTLVCDTILQREEPGLLGEMANSKVGTRNIQMSLEHLSVPESKEMLQNIKQKGQVKGI